MLIADSGGGYSGSTNWFNFEVDGMWRTLENQETDGHWQRVAGWRRTHELAGTHLSRLRSYREGLIQAWPPEKSAASKAYVERLDYLISSVEQSYEAAVANRDAMAGATGAIADARRQLKPLYDEYQRKLAAKQEYDRQQLPAPTSTPSATPTPSPSPGPAPTPPVTQEELDRLNNRARSIMYGLSSELVQAQAQLKPPPTYQGRPALEVDGNPDVYGGGPPPTVPPVVPVPTTATGTSMPIGGAPVHQAVPTPSTPSIGPVLGGNGPTLGGVAPTIPAPAPTTPVTPPVITPSPSIPPSIGPGYPSPLPPAPSRFGAPHPGSLGTNPVAGGVTKPGIGGAANIPHTMPTGGMIGGMPGVGQPGAGVSPARRINPVGGMIGSSGTGGIGIAPAGGGQRASSRPGQPRDERGTGRQWDPDNPWETEEGVAPVVRAPRDIGNIDPGPAIGLNR
ncbi:hypothetical protein ACI2K4_21240 [Micromonospora sp. NPDC050397]|uniref:hypothetical protein n=1 Tax=Micromonospora sp. NPDC050397 TaxID=3364279 RepID=UPI00384AEB4A